MPPSSLVRDSALYSVPKHDPEGSSLSRSGPQPSNNTGASGALAALRVGCCSETAVELQQSPLVHKLHKTGLLPSLHKSWRPQRQQVRHASSAVHRWLQPQPAEEGRLVQRPTASPEYPSQGAEAQTGPAATNGEPRAHRWIPQRGPGQQQQRPPWPPSKQPLNGPPWGRAPPNGFANGEQRANRWSPWQPPAFLPEVQRRRPPPGGHINAFRPRPQQQRPPANAGGRPRLEGPRKLPPPPKPRPPEKDIVLGLDITVAGLARQLGGSCCCSHSNE
jgi:hypothetical protein